ncbi:hypothetical protein PUN28_000360 [Cardiocondyla obscurior]|uniref:Uncharacterized protein n=1 Tax=Cardiocondyla obscurior TaxID=286306 RepID=A0AAW2GZ06_9HYME
MSLASTNATLNEKKRVLPKDGLSSSGVRPILGSVLLPQSPTPPPLPLPTQPPPLPPPSPPPPPPPPPPPSPSASCSSYSESTLSNSSIDRCTSSPLEQT